MILIFAPVIGIAIILISLKGYPIVQFMATDIDRKLAIYYHPLFQQIIKCVTRLFKQGDSMEIGLLQFVEFNLKLQKALLPAFQKQNAIVSGLNDWVKQVAECLTYQGMVSTNRCVDITSENFVTVLQREMDSVKINLFSQKDQYIKTMIKLSSHDAFKLLGVRINKQVFSKFMFDLCSTWCQFLDVQLFSYFLFGLYVQISKGQTLEYSQFRITEEISPVELEFMEQFQQLKSNYNKNRKKQLRYYRAWCQWNYLRVNEIGEALILQLDQVHPEDNRILQIALIFEKAIQVINQEITNQNPVIDQQKQIIEAEKEQPNKQFLILKKIYISPSKQQRNQKQQRQKQLKEANKEKALRNYYQDQHIQSAEYQQDFEIEIDEDGNMYLKRIVKLPIIGVKIEPQLFENKEKHKKMHLEKKKEQMRQVSNLYRKMIAMKVRLEHNPRNDPYAFRKNPKIAERDQFYRKKDQQEKIVKNTRQMRRTIHDKIKKEQSDASNKNQQFQNQNKQITSKQVEVRDKNPKSIRQDYNYIHKVIAPSFLTNDKYNIEYMPKQGKVYSTTVGLQKRNLKIGLPKLNMIEKIVKPMSSYHYIGRLTNDRAKINQKIRSYSNYQSTQDHSITMIQKLRDQNQYIINRYINKEQLKQLTNYEQFYKKIEVAKKKFGLQFQSEYRRNLKPILLYENRRYDLGGVISEQDHQRFYNRMQRLIKKDERKKNKRKRRQKNRRFKSIFKDKKQKTLYEDVFLNYHRQAIKSIKQTKMYNVKK